MSFFLNTWVSFKEKKNFVTYSYIDVYFTQCSAWLRVVIQINTVDSAHWVFRYLTTGSLEGQLGGVGDPRHHCRAVRTGRAERGKEMSPGQMSLDTEPYWLSPVGPALKSGTRKQPGMGGCWRNIPWDLFALRSVCQGLIMTRGCRRPCALPRVPQLLSDRIRS